jgi:hypothetical protein
MAGVLLVAVVWMSVGGEQHLFSTRPAPVQVEVLTAVAARPDDSAPPSYVYVVSLPDGTRARYSSERLYRPGDRITLLFSRGKLTGRILLSTPAVDTFRSSERP